MINLSKYFLALWFAVFVTLWLILTRSWPYVGDATLMRYVVLSLSHHQIPYREIHDINFPGTYLLDWLTLHLFGEGAIGLRCYDSALLIIAGAVMPTVTAFRSRIAGFCAACLLALFHGRDGPRELGQRDLAIAVLLLLAIAAMVSLSKKWRPLPAVLAGVFVGVACTIKPIGLLILLVSIPLMKQLASSERREFWGCVLSGLALPLIGALIYLHHEGALRSFITVLIVDIPYHARLGKIQIGSLLRQLFTPSLLVMMSIVGLGYLLYRDRDLETKITTWGIVAGALCFLVQFRGYNYHRYPFVACLLLAIALTLSRMLYGTRWKFSCALCLVIYCAALCPLYLKTALKQARTNPPVIEALDHELVKEHSDEQYQCIDSIGGCITALVHLGVRQPTGMMYDEFLFNRDLPVGLQVRRDAFLSEISLRPPLKLIITEGLFPVTRTGYAKLTVWPAFENWLNACYALDEEHRFPATRLPESLGYRIYRRLEICSPTRASR